MKTAWYAMIVTAAAVASADAQTPASGDTIRLEGGQPDGTCNANAGENSSTCPFDCM